MTIKTTSEQLGDAVTRALRHWRPAPGAGQAAEVTPLPPATPPFTVGISREYGANGGAVARALGARLGWPVYDRELVVKIAEEMGLNSRLLESVDEKRGNWLQECLAGFSSASGPDAGAYVHRLAQSLLSLAAHGECVILGRGAAQVLPPQTTLRVRLIAPLDERIEVIRERLGVSPEEALRKITQTDRDRSRFVWDHFYKDPTDPHLYDLVLNSSRLGVEGCTVVIADVLRQMQDARKGGR